MRSIYVKRKSQPKNQRCPTLSGEEDTGGHSPRRGNLDFGFWGSECRWKVRLDTIKGKHVIGASGTATCLNRRTRLNVAGAAEQDLSSKVQVRCGRTWNAGSGMGTRGPHPDSEIIISLGRHQERKVRVRDVGILFAEHCNCD